MKVVIIFDFVCETITGPEVIEEPILFLFIYSLTSPYDLIADGCYREVKITGTSVANIRLLLYNFVEVFNGLAVGKLML